MRRPVVAGNWKMNCLQSEASDLALSLIERKELTRAVEVVLAPPFTALAVVRKLVEGSGIQLAGQNIYFESKGAWTGEISAAQLKDSGCKYVILGHSERRSYFHEDDALINKNRSTSITEVSSLLRACPPPRTARSGPHGHPVGTHAVPPHEASRVALVLRMRACCRHYPDRTAGWGRSSCPAMPAFPVW